MARMTSFAVVESHLRKPALSQSDWEEIVMLTDDPSVPSAHILADGVLTPSKWEEIAKLIQAAASRSGIMLGREAPSNSWTSQALSVYNKIGPAGKLAARHIDKVPDSVKRLLVGRVIGNYVKFSRDNPSLRQAGHGLVPGTTKTRAQWTSEEVYEEEILERFRDYLPGCDCKMCVKFRTTAESDIRMKRFAEAIAVFNRTFFSEDHDPRTAMPSHKNWAVGPDGSWAEYEPYPSRPGIRTGFTLEMGVPKLSEIEPIAEDRPLFAEAQPAPEEPPPARRRRRRPSEPAVSLDELAETLSGSVVVDEDEFPF
jgi:hypothetical protein